MSDMLHRILLVDDEPSIVNALARELRQGVAEGMWPALKVETFTSPDAALARGCECSFSLFISDCRMPGMNGVQLLATLREQQPDAIRVILSGQTDHDGLIGAINRAQITRFLAKPWNTRELLVAVQQFLKLYEERIETRALADLQRLAQGSISPQEAERRRLERMGPGLTPVDWSPDSTHVLDPRATRA
jgi:two-component system probable response regulator PhcQ